MGRIIEKTRKSPKEKTKPVYLVVCEGKNKTEKLYLNNYNKRCSDYILKLESSEDTDPESMLEICMYYIDKYDISTLDGDKVFCLMDLDNSKKKITLVKQLLSQYPDVQIITSNPCFEIWFLLHFTNKISSRTQNSVINELKKHIKNYEKSKDVYKCTKEIRENTMIALDRAYEKNKQYESSNINILDSNANPNTEVYKLIDLLIK